MDQSFFAQIMAAFGAGLLSSLSPCVYPIIPISVGYLGSQSGEKSRWAIFLFFLGQVSTFTGLGIVAVKLGEVFGFSNDIRWVNLGMGVLLVIFGIASLVSYTPRFFHNWNNLNQKLHDSSVHHLLLSFLVGSGSALLASPCTSPILGSVLLSLATTATFLRGITLMVSYSIGISLLFLALGLGILALDKMPKAGKWMGYVHKFSSVIIVVAGAYYIYRGVASV